ncbi:SubName: Full=Probable mitochondrial aconitate hydratase {ECO:0000313/EMBL:CCA69000.1} [Serendipita indica DSM 11827]|uniref:Probable mitochondrial aconitate hydratase n=1 Tax=Serendipita indica (strain DSM 11827) TaxID=1109443 RepID=G4TCE6_SERID|nr:SubName: Full=Probable mitochondrial aconitate hydratase {ECO:0000313/EMBL:CCA69000.1} [Serendipita indica DSM 11827]CCA69000.1 probable mitochondrial aconitate hydratase [Serendipita indica DSM 11827]
MTRIILRQACSRLQMVKRSYASAASSSKRNDSKKSSGDPRIENMKNALYPPERTDRSTAPTGLHRPDAPAALERVITSPEAHETIERAWMIWQKRKRDAREAELKRKFECMKRAMDDLEKTDLRLYRIATSKPDPRKMEADQEQELKGYRGADKRAIEARIEGLFPRELRIPTDTPPRDGWIYDWKPPVKAADKPGGF